MPKETKLKLWRGEETFLEISNWSQLNWQSSPVEVAAVGSRRCKVEQSVSTCLIQQSNSFPYQRGWVFVRLLPQCDLHRFFLEQLRYGIQNDLLHIISFIITKFEALSNKILVYAIPFSFISIPFTTILLSHPSNTHTQLWWPINCYFLNWLYITISWPFS